MENRYNKVKELIANNEDIFDFADYGDGVSEDWIEKVENRLQVKFPPSYKWWLKNYSGGSINGEEIYSIYDVDFSNVPGGDIVYINELERSRNLYNVTLNDKLLIHNNDQAETYFLDLSEQNEKGENPVKVISGEDIYKYADDFLEFIEKKMKE